MKSRGGSTTHFCSVRRLTATNDRAQLALVAHSFRFAVARIFHFAAITRADAGTPDSLARGLETLKFGPGAHTPSERRTDKNQNEKGCSQIALHQTA